MSKKGNIAEEALTISEQGPHFLVEAIPTLVWRAGPDGNIDYVNKRVLEYLGAPLGEIIGWGWMEKVHPDDVAFKVATWLKNLESGNPHDAVCRFRGADGRYRWFEVRGEPLRASDGRVLSWYGVLIDIDERRRAEEALRESEYKLRKITETQPGLLWSNGPDGEPTHINQRMLDYSGMPFEDFKHRGWEAFVHPADYPETAEAFYHAIQTGTSYEGVIRLRRTDGEFRWHHARCEPLRDRQGRIIQWYGLSVDIDERKQAEDRLRRSEAYLAEAQRLSRTGSFGWTPSTGELHWSDETFRLLEYDPSIKPTIERVLQRIHPDDRAMIRQLIDETSRGEKDFDVTHRLLMPDGSVKFVHVLGHALKDAAGNLEIVGALMDVSENICLYRDLAEREAKIRRLVEANIIGIFIGDFDGRILEANDAFLRIVRYDREDLAAGRINWKDLTPRDWRERDAQWIEEHRRTGVRLPIEKEYIRKDGGRVPILLGSATFEEGGDQSVTFVLDLTERKQAEEALRESTEALCRSEAYLAEAQRLSHTGTAVFNDTAFLYWSDENYRIYGFDPRGGFPSRKAALERIHPDDRERAREVARKAVEQKKDYTLEFRILLPVGTVKYTELKSHPKFSASGELVEVVDTIIDVTERKRAEHALRSTLDGIAGLIVVLAANGEVETVNRQVFEYFGRSLDSLKNWGTNDTVHPEDLPRTLEVFKRAMASGNPFQNELRLRRSDGEYRWFDTRHVPIRDDSGRIARWYVLATDIEDRSRALARLEQMRSDFAHMNRVSMMGELAASLSHEITQPIASARNNARAALNFLHKQPPDVGEVGEALGCVVGDADRAGNIVDRIRDHIKKTPPRKEHFDLNQAINEVIVLGRSAVIKNGVSVQTRLSEGLFPIHCDRVQLQQVVLNLILNAAEAMGSVEAEPRELLISTEQHHTGVLVAVRDSGPGIDPTHLERVFEAFYTTKSSGVGMGLSICRSIIDAHGGRLWAEANEPRGAIFQFTLPSSERSS